MNPEPVETTTRLGIEWCREHHQPVIFCRSDHNWGRHNSVRKYTSLMVTGKAHPFASAGGPITGVEEGDDALATALSESTVEDIPVSSLVATSQVTPQHVGLMLSGQAPPPRSGNNPFEHADHSTVIRMGKRHVLADGHHRAVSAWAKGSSHLKARVVKGITPTFRNSNRLLVSAD